MPTTKLEGEALGVLKRKAIAWIDEQNWVNDIWRAVIKKEISEVKTIILPISNSTVYRSLRLGVMDLSQHMIDYPGGIHSLVQALQVYDPYILRLQIELLTLMAMVDNHSVPDVLSTHPCDKLPHDHQARIWYESTLAEIARLTGKEANRDIVWASNLVSQRITYGGNAPDKADKRLSELKKDMLKFKSRARNTNTNTPIKDEADDDVQLGSVQPATPTGKKATNAARPKKATKAAKPQSVDDIDNDIIVEDQQSKQRDLTAPPAKKQKRTLQLSGNEDEAGCAHSPIIVEDRQSKQRDLTAPPAKKQKRTLQLSGDEDETGRAHAPIGVEHASTPINLMSPSQSAEPTREQLREQLAQATAANARHTTALQESQAALERSQALLGTTTASLEHCQAALSNAEIKCGKYKRMVATMSNMLETVEGVAEEYERFKEEENAKV